MTYNQTYSISPDKFPMKQVRKNKVSCAMNLYYRSKLFLD